MAGHLRERIHIIDMSSPHTTTVPSLIASLQQQPVSSDPSSSETDSVSAMRVNGCSEQPFLADYHGIIKLGSRRFAKFAVWRPTPTVVDLFAWVQSQWRLKLPDFAVHLVGDEDPSWLSSVVSMPSLELIFRRIALALQVLLFSYGILVMAY